MINEQKLIDKIHEMQNEDLSNLESTACPSLDYSHLNGKIVAFSEVIKSILLDGSMKEGK